MKRKVKMLELEHAMKEAISFVESYPPNDAAYIGKVTSKHNQNIEYFFYKDQHGGYWYETKKIS